MVLSKNEILGKVEKGPKIHLVKVTAWGGDVVALQELNGLQIMEWDQASMARAEKPNLALDKGTGAEHMAALSIVECQLDENGEPVRGTAERIFGDRPADILKVRNLGGALQEIYSHALRINRLLRAAEEDAEKNSSQAPSSDTGAISPIAGAVA